MTSEQFNVFVDRDLEELIPEYVGSIRANIDKIYILLEENNMDQIRSIGHNMKGSGGGYGFDKISEIGLVIENGSKTGDIPAIKTALELLRHYLDNVFVEFVDVE